MVQRFSFLIPLAALVLLAGLAIACQAKRPHNNLALRHPAYHSSAIDYNATAQLAVDGILQASLTIADAVKGSPSPWTGCR